MAQEKLFLVALFLGSFLVRALFFGLYQRYDDRAWLAFDSEQYHQVALQIALGNGISTADCQPNFYRLPGYPAFLAAGYKLFNFSVEKTLWLQLVLASFIPVLIFVLAQILLGSMLLAKIAAGIAMLHPGFIMYAGTVSTESLFLLFFLLFLCCFFTAPSYRILLVASLFLGVASLIRAVGHYILVLALIYFLFMRSQRIKKIAAAGVLSGGWLAVVSWWLLRNYLLAGAIFFHTLPGLHFLQYSATYVVQDLEHCDYFVAKKKIFAEWDRRVEHAEQKLKRPVTEYERFACAEKLAYAYLFGHPIVALKHAVVQIMRTCCTLYSTILLYVPLGTVYGDASLWFKAKLYLLPNAIHQGLIPLIYWELILFGVMAMGWMLLMFRAVRDKHARMLLFKILPFMFLLIGITLAYGCARLRFAVEPFMIIGVVYGLFYRLSSSSACCIANVF